MMQNRDASLFVAIACGGTGGHLFPGLAVAESLQERGCEIVLLVSDKEIDQVAAQSASGMEVLALPAVALQNGDLPGFLHGLWRSYRVCITSFSKVQPHAVLAMGGFTSAGPVLAGKRVGAATFLHESNAVPGRANRWLAPLVDMAFAGFTSASRQLAHQHVVLTGTPVRPQFKPIDSGSCRTALGLDPDDPVVLVMGGSQGASAINEWLLRALPAIAVSLPRLQFIHLTGTNDRDKVIAQYKANARRAVVLPFLTEMELALGAATVALTRAGASSLAELSAMRLPAILVPYPSAVDNHQFYNAKALADTGAARLVEQSSLTVDRLVASISELVQNERVRQSMQAALDQWHSPQAAEQISDEILDRLQQHSAIKPSARKREPVERVVALKS
jgi:UDP-N-acetylglucosamine--N-acetylmuramyl-(pentapeptide) pyrophosphoryl-undecaprenol N-acetylglucosamine transferase